jgi:hypothetical protein
MAAGEMIWVRFWRILRIRIGTFLEVWDAQRSAAPGRHLLGRLSRKTEVNGSRDGYAIAAQCLGFIQGFIGLAEQLFDT